MIHNDVCHDVAACVVLSSVATSAAAAAAATAPSASANSASSCFSARRCLWGGRIDRLLEL